MFVFALVGSGAAEQTGGFVGFTFFAVMFGGYLLDTRERYEWMTMLVFAGVGVHSAFDITAAAAVAGYLPDSYEFSVSQTYDVSTFQETALGFVFFTWFTVFLSLDFWWRSLDVATSALRATRDGSPSALLKVAGTGMRFRCKSLCSFGLLPTWQQSGILIKDRLQIASV